MLGDVGEGSSSNVWETQRSLPWHLHLESPCRTGDPSLKYEPTKFCYASLGDREGGYKQKRFQYVGEH